ncbi:hypothetical protein AK830_g12572, partial [Neonectria ditissima]
CRCVSADGSVGCRSGANVGGGGAACATAAVVDGDAMDGGGDVGCRGESDRDADADAEDDDEAAAAVDMVCGLGAWGLRACHCVRANCRALCDSREMAKVF